MLINELIYLVRILVCLFVYIVMGIPRHDLEKLRRTCCIPKKAETYSEWEGVYYILIDLLCTSLWIKIRTGRKFLGFYTSSFKRDR